MWSIKIKEKSFFCTLPRIVIINILLLTCLALPVELIFGNWITGPNFGNLNIPRKMTRHFDTKGLYPGGGKGMYVRDEYGLRGGL
jgi:hypothetical protein